MKLSDRLPILLLGVGAGVLVVSAAFQEPYPIGETLVGRDMIAIDGDTLRFGDQRIRLAGIDAPEMEGHCRPGRNCVQGDPIRSQWALHTLVTDEMIECRVEGIDRYQRLVATCVRQRDRLNINQFLVDLGYAEPYRYERGVQ